MRRELGVVPDGSDRLATVYSSFESGHEEPDLIAASELLGEATPHRGQPPGSDRTGWSVAS
jgi:hypothetical protein